MGVLEKIMGVQKASEMWGLSPGYIKNLCNEGKIDAVRIGKTWVLNKEQGNPRKEKP